MRSVGKGELPMHIAGDVGLDALGGEGPTWLVAASVEIPAGRSEQVVIRFQRRQALSPTVVPSARIPPVRWTTPSGSRQDGAPFVVDW